MNVDLNSQISNTALPLPPDLTPRIGYFSAKMFNIVTSTVKHEKHLFTKTVSGLWSPFGNHHCPCLGILM